MCELTNNCTDSKLYVLLKETLQQRHGWQTVAARDYNEKYGTASSLTSLIISDVNDSSHAP